MVTIINEVVLDLLGFDNHVAYYCRLYIRGSFNI